MAEQNGGLFVWLQDNARIILSIALVLFLLFAVYNYSQNRTDSVSRTENNVKNENKTSEESKNANEVAENSDKAEEGSKEEGTEKSKETKVIVDNDKTTEVTEDETKPDKEVAKISLSESTDTIGAKTEKPKEEKAKTEEPTIKKEDVEITGKGPNVIYNENDITVSAMNGDGLTHLARRAATEYINHNNISDLTAGQRIYIEDYVRKTVASKRIKPGNTIAFKHDVFKTAIDKAKSLTESQRRNLSNYAKKAGL